MSHKLFHLYKRQTKKGTVWYTRFYDKFGNRLPGRSTHQKTRAAAENWCIQQIKKGVIASDKNIRFSEYARDWWIWDKCLYVKTQIARGRSLSRRYVDEMHGLLDNYILPYFKDMKLSQITTRQVDEWLLKLRERPGRNGTLSAVTINRAFSCFRIMMNQAFEWEYINRVPLKKNMILHEKPRERGILTAEEIQKLFHDNAVIDVWNGNLKTFTANMLSLTTGMRQAEIIGLLVKNVNLEYVSIQNSYSTRYGIIPPKWRSIREVPIPRLTSESLQELISESPYQEANDFVFYGKSRDKPLNSKTLLRSFRQALTNIGIDEAEQKARNLVFHSWRHTFNSFMRGRISDAKLQKLTGHRTERMLDNYTHVSDLRDVIEAQEQLLP